KPESEGAQCAPSSPVPGLRREAMKGHLTRWRLPEKPGPHCEPQSQSLSRIWVKKEPMKTCVTLLNVSRKADSDGVLWTLLEAARRGKKRAGMEYDTNPASGR